MSTLSERVKENIISKTIYIASDGSKHDSENLAIEHEMSLARLLLHHRREMMTSLVNDELKRQFTISQCDDIVEFIISKSDSILNILK